MFLKHAGKKLEKQTRQNPNQNESFTPFQANVLFLYPLKTQKTTGCLTFSGGIDMKNWRETNFTFYSDADCQ